MHNVYIITSNNGFIYVILYNKKQQYTNAYIARTLTIIYIIIY